MTIKEVKRVLRVNHSLDKDTISDMLIMAECNAGQPRQVWGTPLFLCYSGDGRYTMSHNL